MERPSYIAHLPEADTLLFSCKRTALLARYAVAPSLRVSCNVCCQTEVTLTLRSDRSSMITHCTTAGFPLYPQPVLPLAPLVGPSTFPQAPVHGSTDSHTEAHPQPPYAGRREPLGYPRTRVEGFGILVFAHERQHLRFEVCFPHRAYPTTRPPSDGENKFILNKPLRKKLLTRKPAF